MFDLKSIQMSEMLLTNLRLG